MKSIVPLLGFVVFLWCFVRFAGEFGFHWECGRYFMPRTIADPDGCSYPDGEPIPAVIQMLVQLDIEEEVSLTLTCGLMASLLWLAVEVRKLHRMGRKYRETFGRDFRSS